MCKEITLLIYNTPSVTFHKPPNPRQLIVDTSHCTHNPATPTGSRPCNRPRCKTCPIHPPASSCINLTYPITTHSDYKSMNLIYQLQCNVRNAFYIGETCRSLSLSLSLSLTAWMDTVSPPVSNSDLPAAILTQSHQIPFQDWAVSIIHKHLIPPLTTFAASLKLHTHLFSNHITLQA